MSKPSWRDFWPLVGANLLWSGNFVAGRILGGYFGPWELNALRWTVAALILGPLLLWREGWRGPGERVPWRDLAWLSLTGILAFNGLTYWALHSIPATRAAVVNAFTPALTLVISRWLIPGPAPRGAASGIILSILGVALVVGGGHSSGLAAGWHQGDGLVLLAVLAWSVYTVKSQPLLARFSPLRLLTWSVYLALPFVDVLGLRQALGRPLPPPAAWLGVLYIGIFASVVAFWWWSAGVARVGARRAAPLLNLLPVFTALVAAAVLGERPTLWELLGGVLVLLGVSAASRRA